MEKVSFSQWTNISVLYRVHRNRKTSQYGVINLFVFSFVYLDMKGSG